MAASERGPRFRRAATPAAEEQQPLPARAGGRVAAAEQDGAHLRGRGRRGHAGGLLRRRAPLSALLPGREGRGAGWSPAAPSSLRDLCTETAVLHQESVRLQFGDRHAPGKASSGRDGAGATPQKE